MTQFNEHTLFIRKINDTNVKQIPTMTPEKVPKYLISVNLIVIYLFLANVKF